MALRHDVEQYRVPFRTNQILYILPSSLLGAILSQWELGKMCRKLGTRYMHALRAWFLIMSYPFLLSSTTRNLAEIFMVLPTRKELPDYYQIIKHPVDIRKIRVPLFRFYTPPTWMTINCYSTTVSLISVLNRTCYSHWLHSQLYHWPWKSGVFRKAFVIHLWSSYNCSKCKKCVYQKAL